MENADHLRRDVGDAPCAADHGAANDGSRFGWMPNSGYGPYCIIPFSAGIGDDMCRAIGLASFVSTRREARILADEYAGQALALKAKARQERHLLSIATRGPGGEALIRPNRLRLCLDWNRSAGYLYLGWRGAVRKRDRWARIRPPRLWNCESDTAALVARAHPDEVELVARIEAEAAEIRRRWFALVRMVHYMNVAEHHRMTDAGHGARPVRRGSGVMIAVSRALRRVLPARVLIRETGLQ